MPVTALDPATALVVIDLQKGIVGLQTVHPIGEVVARAGQLARAFRARGLPVVLVNVTGIAPGRTDAGMPKFAPPEGWADIVAELDPQPGDYRVSKQRWGAFIGTSLDAHLRQHHVTQVVLLGVATSIGVESTARSLFDAGYTLTLVVDAMTDRDSDAHRNSLEKIFPRLGQLETTANLLGLLQPGARPDHSSARG
jgi:nicotinamidase-related amidase